MKALVQILMKGKVILYCLEGMQILTIIFK